MVTIFALVSVPLRCLQQSQESHRSALSDRRSERADLLFRGTALLLQNVSSRKTPPATFVPSVVPSLGELLLVHRSPFPSAPAVLALDSWALSLTESPLQALLTKIRIPRCNLRCNPRFDTPPTMSRCRRTRAPEICSRMPLVHG
jgi:hypothetical protein